MLAQPETEKGNMLVKEKGLWVELGRPPLQSCMSHLGMGWYFNSSFSRALLLNGIVSLELRHWACHTTGV